MSTKAKNTKSNTKGKNAVSGVCGAKNPRNKVELYNKLKQDHPTWTKERCKLEAGYSRKTHTDEIEHTRTFKDLQTRIQDAQVASGVNAKMCLKRLATTIKRKGADRDGEATRAVKVATEITGERMPEVVQTNISGDDQLLGSLLGR